jgi:hypothetical protein
MKTLVAAADAAAAENPSRKSAQRSADRPAEPGIQAPQRRFEAPPAKAAPTQKAAQSAAQGVRQVRGVRRGLRRGFQEAWKPVARLSGVLWLEITGLLFGLLALSAAGAVWRLHGLWSTGRSGRAQIAGAAAMCALFSYFCVTSFVRARRRERQR